MSDLPESVRAALERLQEAAAEILEPHLITIDDEGYARLMGMHADSADKLIRHVLDELQCEGEIVRYDYESIRDPFDETLYANVSMLVEMVPGYIMIDLDLPRD